MTLIERRLGSAGLALCVAVLLLLIAEAAQAQNSLGIGRPEQAIRPEGPFAGILFWIQQQQQAFYKLLTGELQAMRGSATHLWTLVGLSFAYGIFHAAGPGHGKAVISSYMLANEVAARRGIVLSFASAFLQAVTAIAIISVLLFFLRGAGLRQGDLTRWLEIASYAGVTLLGAWLLYAKITGRGHSHHDYHGSHEHGHVHDHEHAHDDDHLHAPDPKQLRGDFGLKEAWSAIIAVGLRPCTGAIIVLTFAFLNGLYFAGIASTFAMALGTGMTVASLAAIAVWAKDLAIYVSGASGSAARVHRGIEIGGAALVFLLGLTLLSASLY